MIIKKSFVPMFAESVKENRLFGNYTSYIENFATINF